MRVIGTAGHVDHGKSTLIKALTGTHPDRLKEEQEREMTIDLGFGWWTLPDGEELGVVDVPGHRDFIENMLAGVGGIDAVLFVVAADEGIMPQTREHLAILNLLKIPAGLVAITKIDMVQDAEWIDLVEEELLTALQDTVLEDAPVVRVSAVTGKGLEELQAELVRVLQVNPPRPDIGRPRLAVDRSFSVKGFGTIVTGTLLDGVFSVGDEVEILPEKIRARIRGLQSHKRKEETAAPGTRTAMNLSGVDLSEVKRGDLIARPDVFQPSGRIDVKFDLLADASQPLQHDDEVKLFIGTSERIARVRLIGREQLLPGESGWLQIETRELVVCFRGDRFILRRPSPGETIGGGRILDANPGRRYKRFNQRVLDKFTALEKGDPGEIILEAMGTTSVFELEQIQSGTGLSEEGWGNTIQALIQSGAVIVLKQSGDCLQPKDLLISLSGRKLLTEKLVRILSTYHADFPLIPGIRQEELKSKLNLPQNVFQALLQLWVSENTVKLEAGISSLPDFEIRFTDKQEKLAADLLRKFEQEKFSPPTYKTCVEFAGEELVRALISLGKLVQLSPEVLFPVTIYGQIVEHVKVYIKQNGSITAAQLRDELGTSRRYALAILEHLDAIKFTLRNGDFRTLRG